MSNETPDREELRIILAAVAMHALLTQGSYEPSGIAEDSFKVADAMVAAAEEYKQEEPLP